MGKAYYPDGREIPESEYQDAIEKGTFGARKGDVLTFRAPNGDRYTVPAESAREALDKGWAPETPTQTEVAELQEEESLRGPVHAAAGTIFDVATFGLGTKLMSQEDKRDLALHQSAFELPTEIAGVVGAAATLPVGGAVARSASALARVGGFGNLARVLGGTAEATGALGKAGLTAARWGFEGAVEGGAYSAGREYSRQSMGNEDLSVEKILSEAGEGALFGGATGAAVGGIGRVLGSGFSKAYDTVAPKFKAPIGLGGAEWQAARAFGLRAEDAIEVGRGDAVRGVARINKFGEEVLGRKIIDPLDNLNTRIKKGQEATDEIGKQLGQAWKSLDTAGYQVDKSFIASRHAKLMGELSDEMPARIVRSLKRDWEGLIAKADTFEGLHRLDSRMRQSLPKISDDLTSQALHRYRRELKGGLREAVEAVNPDAAAHILKLDDAYGAMASVMNVAVPRAVKGELKEPPFTPWDLGVAAGAVATGSPFGLVYAGVKTAAQWGKKSERAAAALSLALDRMRNSVQVQGEKVSDSVLRTAMNAPVTLARVGAPRAAVLANEYAERAKATRQAHTNPPALLERLNRVLSPLAAADPDLARKATVVLAADAQWLAARLPGLTLEDSRRMMKDSLARQEKAWKQARKAQATMSVPQTHAAEFVRTSRALANPVAEIEKLGEGGLNPELAAVLAERRPKLLNSIIVEFDDATVKLAQSGKVMSYDTRIRATLVTGKSYDFTMDPEFIRMSQGVWDANRNRTPAQAPAGRRVTPNAMRKRLERLQTNVEDIMDPSDSGG